MQQIEQIKQIIETSIAVKQKLLLNATLLQTVEQIVQATVSAYQLDKRVYFCGNGGSAADAQHLAAEFSGRFYINRKPLYAEALHVNTSYITAVANDFSYNDIYSRMIEAAGRKGDILFAISTSGNSQNIINAIEVAKNQGVICVGMTGETGGKMKELCDFLLNVPSKETPRIQESHILLGHIICELVEKQLFGE
jgi:D-sedoheptulose 7-phosphate isomerase